MFDASQYDLQARNFTALEQADVSQFDKTLTEGWVGKAFRWIDTTLNPGSVLEATDKHTSVWTQLADVIDLNKDGKISETEIGFFHETLARRLRSDEEGVAQLLRRLVIKHDSEWHGGSNHQRWQNFYSSFNTKAQPYLKQWRDDTEWMSQVDAFKDGKPVWHFHPLEFLQAIKQNNKQIIFPLIVKPENDPLYQYARYDWRDMHAGNMAAFNTRRGGGTRKHAARDLYTQPLAEVVAVCNGQVLGTGAFYDGTHEVTVLHQTKDGRKFIVRYGELAPSSINVRKGSKILQGQSIGKTGKLINPQTNQPRVILQGKVIYMLHFEFYTGISELNIASSLTNRNNPPYLRRHDLADPIDILSEGYKNTFESENNELERKKISSLCTSDNGKFFIKEWESMRLNAYDDTEGFCTIGFGHLIERKSCSAFELPTEFQGEITKKKAIELFERDIRRFEGSLRRSISVNLYQYEFDALISLLFNCGEYFFLANKAPNLLRLLNSCEYDKAAYEFLDITNHGNTGLVKRRSSEHNLFMNGIYNATH